MDRFKKKKKKENIDDSFPNGNFLIDGFNTL